MIPGKKIWDWSPEEYARYRAEWLKICRDNEALALYRHALRRRDDRMALVYAKRLLRGPVFSDKSFLPPKRQPRNEVEARADGETGKLAARARLNRLLKRSA